MDLKFRSDLHHQKELRYTHKKKNHFDIFLPFVPVVNDPVFSVHSRFLDAPLSRYVRFPLLCTVLVLSLLDPRPPSSVTVVFHVFDMGGVLPGSRRPRFQVPFPIPSSVSGPLSRFRPSCVPSPNRGRSQRPVNRPRGPRLLSRSTHPDSRPTSLFFNHH